VVVASDAFKGSLTSLEVGDAVRLGLLDVARHAEVVVVPVADGGEGTVAAALATGWGAVPVEVHGPTGAAVTATLAIRGGEEGLRARLGTAALGRSSAEAADRTFRHPVRSETGRTVLVEMADACGIGRLPDAVPAPLTASSRGLGEAIRAALDLGAAEIIVGVGGSASTDGGAGMLCALGARLLDADGVDLTDGGAALAGLAHLDLTGLDPRLATARLVLAADVDSPLLGPTGAAAVFAPQKGATAAEVDLLEAALTHWATVVEAHPGMPGAGAAGGVGFALLAVLEAERASGVEVVLDLVGLDAALAGADLVVTGEGSLDAQTLAGKAVRGVAQRAAAPGIPVVAVCGRLALDDADLAALGVRAAYPLSELEPDPRRSIEDAAALLRRTGQRIAREELSRRPG
jgi:glycerate 2-kinase